MKAYATPLSCLLLLALPILSCGRGAAGCAPTAASPTAAIPTPAVEQASADVPPEYAALYAELSLLLSA